MKRIVVAASIAQKPAQAGHTWVFLQYLLGFRRRGYDVLFVDRLEPEMCVDRGGNPAPFESSFNLEYFAEVMARFGLDGHWALLYDAGREVVGRSRGEVVERRERRRDLEHARRADGARATAHGKAEVNRMGHQTYDETFECGEDEGSHSNTAVVTETDSGATDDSTATTEVFCYELTVTKDAATSFDRDYDWTVAKTRVFAEGEVDGDLDPTTLTIDPNQTYTLTYEITVDLATLFAAVPERLVYEDVITYPAVRQDIAVAVDEDVPAGALVDAAREAAGPLLREARVFDVYRGEQVGAGRKSVAVHLTFQSSERTLTDEDAAALRSAIVEALAERYDAELRA